MSGLELGQLCEHITSQLERGLILPSVQTPLTDFVSARVGGFSCLAFLKLRVLFHGLGPLLWGGAKLNACPAYVIEIVFD